MDGKWTVGQIGRDDQIAELLPGVPAEVITAYVNPGILDAPPAVVTTTFPDAPLPMTAVIVLDETIEKEAAAATPSKPTALACPGKIISDSS